MLLPPGDTNTQKWQHISTLTQNVANVGIADLLQDGSDVPEGERAKLAVLKEVIKVLLQHLKHQTGVALVLEAFVRTHKVVFICVLCAQPV